MRVFFLLLCGINTHNFSRMVRLGCLAGIVCLFSSFQSSHFFKLSDVIYATHEGSSRQNSMDIYIPVKGGVSPVIVWIHGGGWSAGSKEHVQDKPDFFTKHGYVFVSVNYRLHTQQKHPVQVQDVADAIAWLARNAHHYSINPKQIYVMGHSAGAHLAALVSVDETYLKKAGATSQLIKGTILLEGAAYDIPLAMREGGDRLKKIYRDAFGDDRTVWKAASPVSHVSSTKSIAPFFIAHAGHREVSEMESTMFATVLTKAGVKNSVNHYPDHNHMTINRLFGNEVDPVCGDVLHFLEEASATAVAESK
jgi:acetyl esterase/lipase